MRTDSFLSTSPGRLVATDQGALAFVPDPLPEYLDLGKAAIHILTDAENALGRLTGTASRILNPYLIGSPLLRRDAILSSRMEGTITTPEELLLFELGGGDIVSETRRDDNQEVSNYIQAMEYAIDRLETLPLTLRFLREVHERLLTGVRGRDERPGEFRTAQNWIGSRRGAPIADARYVPPPVTAMDDCLRDFERYLHLQSGPSVSPLLVRLALIHYQFEAIHPFRDGNGRIGRLLIPLMLLKEGRMNTAVLYVSSYLEKHKETYVDTMLHVSQTGDWQSWVEFFLTTIAESAEDAIRHANRLVALREDYRGRLQQTGASSRVLAVIDNLFHHPAVTAASVSTLAGVTRAGAGGIIKKLVEHKIVREATGRSRNMVYVAPEIIDLIDVS